MEPTIFDPVEAAQDLRGARLRADIHCRDMMREMQVFTRAALAGIRTVHAAQAQGYGFDPAAWEALAAFRARADFCRRHFVIFAVKGAILSGRLPEAEEDAVMTRCAAADDGLTAFLDEMAKVPVGFVDPPVAPVCRN